MRYYKIVITGDDGAVIQSSALRGTAAGGQATFTSYVNGQTLPGALNVQFNIELAELETPVSAAIRVWGIDRDEISQSSNLVGKQITVYAGMKKGLPLADPDQSQMPVCRGMIAQAYGNWQGTEQTLDLVVIGDFGRSGDPRNFSFNWRANQPLSEAIEATMAAALDKVKVECFISPDVKYDYDQPGAWKTLGDFSQAIIQLTNTQKFAGIKTLNGLPYQGVYCIPDLSGEVPSYVFTDNTRRRSEGGDQPVGGFTPGPRQINFKDIIGQPTWMDTNTISFKTVMRSDLAITDQVRFPESIQPVTRLTQGSAPTFEDSPLPEQISRNKSAFRGVFQIQTIQHFGNFRESGGDDWCTTFTAIFNSDHEENKQFVVSEQDSMVTNKTPPNKTKEDSVVRIKKETPDTTTLPPFEIHPPIFAAPSPSRQSPVFLGPSSFVFRR